MTHLESLAVTDLQGLKAEIEGFAKPWKQASYVIHAAIYLDVLSPIKRLSIAMQQEKHDPVKTVCRVQEFTWTIEKLKVLINESLDEEGVMTRYKQLMSLIEQKEDGHYYYQGIKLSAFEATLERVGESYKETIRLISESMENRFANLVTSPVFQHHIQLLDTSSRPQDISLSAFGDKEIDSIRIHFHQVLSINGCSIVEILPEWQALKGHVMPIAVNNKSVKYLDVWKKIFTNADVKRECRISLKFSWSHHLVTPSWKECFQEWLA